MNAMTATTMKYRYFRQAVFFGLVRLSAFALALAAPAFAADPAVGTAKAAVAITCSRAMTSKVASLTPAFFNRTASLALKAQAAEPHAPDTKSRTISSRPAADRGVHMTLPASPTPIGES